MSFTKQFLAASAIALLGSTTAFAQEATPDTWLQAAQSTKTRAEVGAELVAARASGLTKAWSAGYIEPVRASNVQRADVRSQTLQAIRSGEVKAINAEVAGVAPATAALLRTAG